MKNKHSNHNAPTNTHLQPEVVHSSTEIPQQVAGYQVPMKGYTARACHTEVIFEKFQKIKKE